MSNGIALYKLKDNLVGKILISTPSISDLRFVRSVVLLVASNEKNTLGITINKPSAHTFAHLVKSVRTPEKKDDEIKLEDKKVIISLGGPANSHNLFVVHTAEYSSADTVKISPEISMTNQPSVILDLSHGKGPEQSFISIGCALWDKQQLTNELMTTDSWFILDFDIKELFSIPQDKMYDHMLNELGLKDVPSALFMNTSNLFPLVK